MTQDIQWPNLYRVLADRPEWLSGPTVTEYDLASLEQAEQAIQTAWQWDYDLLEQTYGDDYNGTYGDSDEPTDLETWDMLLHSYEYDGWAGVRYEVQSYTDNDDVDPADPDDDGTYTTVARYQFGVDGPELLSP